MIKNNWLRWVLLGLGILIVGGGVFAWQYGQTHFAPKTTINGKSVAGLTANQATQKLASSSSTITNRVYLNGKLLVTGKQQTLANVTKAQVKTALKNHHGLFAKKANTVDLTSSDEVVTYRSNTLEKQVSDALTAYNKTATAAHPTYYYLKDGNIKTQAATKGTQVNVTKALASYKNQIKQLKDIKLKTSSSTATKAETVAAEKVKQNLKDSLTKTLVYHVGGKDYTLKGSDYIVNTKPGQTPTVDLTALEAKLTKINNSDSTQGKSFSVKLLNSGKTIMTNNTTDSNYGWSLSVKSEAKMLADKFISSTIKSGTKVDMKNYSGQNISYNRSSAIGSTRVEINLTTLHEYIYVNGKQKEDIPVMSGTLSGSNKTPTGLFHILYKQSPSTLTGKNDNGSAYASKVSYWEPLTEDGVGMHDSSWQPSKVYGNPTYRSTYHSHGCLNNPPSKMKSVWDNTTTTEPVIIYK
ncbi:L,D-transpeptidase [Pediococcus parvulus]|uniref:L,D-transpeptidase n=1 Tax=Pediococcus parvulus TaxID=54062 RepID=UPI00345E576A